VTIILKKKSMQVWVHLQYGNLWHLEVKEVSHSGWKCWFQRSAWTWHFPKFVTVFRWRRYFAFTRVAPKYLPIIIYQ
jgi:hypothetical protein